jgi:hypothetical protein
MVNEFVSPHAGKLNQPVPFSPYQKAHKPIFTLKLARSLRVNEFVSPHAPDSRSRFSTRPMTAGYFSKCHGFFITRFRL